MRHDAQDTESQSRPEEGPQWRPAARAQHPGRTQDQPTMARLGRVGARPTGIGQIGAGPAGAGETTITVGGTELE